MSELSTVAIKDGHRGHLHHQQQQPLEAERADRISRLAGLGSVAQPRNLAPNMGGGMQSSTMPQAYFDSNNQPQMARERSTVGSASATGSVGGRTTWASGSDVYDPDKMSEDQDVETSSMGGMSDEANSLVGFGEGARTPAATMGSPVASRAGIVPQHMREPASASNLSYESTPGPETHLRDVRNLDGVTYDRDVVDSVSRTPPIIGSAADRG